MKKTELLVRCQAMLASLSSFEEHECNPFFDGYSEGGVFGFGWLTKCFAMGRLAKFKDEDEIYSFWRRQENGSHECYTVANYQVMYNYIDSLYPYTIFRAAAIISSDNKDLSEVLERLRKQLTKNIKSLSSWRV